MIGKGGFGEVYFGTLKDGTDVAVKKLLSTSEQCRKAFLIEVKLLTDVHQRNLVSVEGYCDEDGKEALILEYLSNGTLKQHLSEKSGRVLTWTERLHIALDVACGLEYLHDRNPPIVHRDLKPDNILLNENMHAKIVDFGLSRAFATESATHVSTEHFAGTPGYRDPDSWKIGHIRKEHDVYSFGIILLELVTGKPAIITRDKDERITIIEWIYSFTKRRDIRKLDIQKIVDPKLNDEFNISVAREVIKIAVSCVYPIIEERPDVSQILTKLKECLDREVGDDTSRPNILVGLIRKIRQRQKGAIVKSMEEQQPLNLAIMKTIEEQQPLNLAIMKSMEEQQPPLNLAMMKSMEEQQPPLNLGNVRIFTRAEVATITSNFKEVIEEGPFNKVYRGFLNGGAPVAVKIWSPSSKQEYHEFRTEVELSSHLCHRNVVSAVGYCVENDIKALIYEFMANGNLRQHLSGKCKRILCWKERLQIAIDIAYGLEFLRTDRKLAGVGLKLKSNVIFLNENMQGQIADFRIAKILNKEFGGATDPYEAFADDVTPRGWRTLGQMDALDRFGLILLELLTGWPVTYSDYEDVTCYPHPHIIDRVKPLMMTGNIQRLVDPFLPGKFDINTASKVAINTASKVAKLAMSCVSGSAEQRPDLSHVIVKLKECLALEMHSQQTKGIQSSRESDQQTEGIQIGEQELQDSDEFYLSPR
ncbi:hypothetical protein SLEP1_g44706 [Rubroshorea leprosula]|uniref:Protein kinase domain-containing protein n=1 Tax=Rubroshorea leprosula TaxID=152421 RepID=A0AAV5LI65_9ROSI|nr:hypothetical protein SLEP1_g44706 [Rubroshorea leprosula]